MNSKNCSRYFAIIFCTTLAMNGCSSKNESAGSQSNSGSSSTSERALSITPPQASELTRASRDGDLELVRDLLNRGANPNENIENQNAEDKVTPLLAAAVNGHAEVAQFLLCHGANTAFTFRGWSIRDYLIYAGMSPQCGESR